jgi:hypothetical protein
LIISRVTTNITLNNTTGDGLKLSWPSGETVDSVDYKKAVNNQSYSLFGDSWQWTPVLTPGSKNLFQGEELSARETTTEPVSEDSTPNATDTISAMASGRQNDYFPFLLLTVSLAAAASLGTIILIIKNKIIDK